MGQHYSNPTRANDPHALPDVETFYVSVAESAAMRARYAEDGDAGAEWAAGWYWQACFPGCLPDGEPNGPFATEADAVADAQKGNE